jgi:hypothetical protein
MKKFTGKLERVEWRDHFSDSSWMDRDEITVWVEKHASTMCVSVGTVTYEDRDKLVVSGSVDGGDNYGENMCIFKKDIIKRELLST